MLSSLHSCSSGNSRPDSFAMQEQDETEKQSYADTDTRKMSGLETDASQAIHHFKIIDYGLANFEETYACGPDLTHDEVGLGKVSCSPYSSPSGLVESRLLAIQALQDTSRIWTNVQKDPWSQTRAAALPQG